jgi:hypothetical protein
LGKNDCIVSNFEIRIQRYDFEQETKREK